MIYWTLRWFLRRAPLVRAEFVFLIVPAATAAVIVFVVSPDWAASHMAIATIVRIVSLTIVDLIIILVFHLVFVPSLLRRALKPSREVSPLKDESIYISVNRLKKMWRREEFLSYKMSRDKYCFFKEHSEFLDIIVSNFKCVMTT
jgi:hypothetical protein